MKARQKAEIERCLDGNQRDEEQRDADVRPARHPAQTNAEEEADQEQVLEAQQLPGHLLGLRVVGDQHAHE